MSIPKKEIKSILEKVMTDIPFRFDRVLCVRIQDKYYISIYGWIKTDFVLFELTYSWMGVIDLYNVITSSPKYSETIHERIREREGFTEAEWPHTKCIMFMEWIEEKPKQEEEGEDLMKRLRESIKKLWREQK